jgi:hypothetical protein
MSWNRHTITFWQAFIRACKAIHCERIDNRPLDLRERVYCYELYHQLRQLEDNLQETWVPAIVQAELDKRGQVYFDTRGIYFQPNHPCFSPRRPTNPDFLIHEPNGDHNLSVIQVKVAPSNDYQIADDLRKLVCFIRHDGLQYQLAIFLLVSFREEDLLQARHIVNAAWRQFDNRVDERICVVYHNLVSGLLRRHILK